MKIARLLLAALANTHPLFQLFLVLVFLAAGTNGLAASFSADMVQTDRGRTKTGRFLMEGHQYRMDVEEDGMSVTILVDRKTGKTRIVIPQEKEYMELENDDFLSLLNNPFEGYRMMLEKFQSRQDGTEEIDGISCDRVILFDANKDLVTAWVAKPYGFPVRIVNLENGMEVELKNIREEPAGEARFQVPAGYTLKEDPAKKRAREEAALPVVTALVKGEAPWARRIGPGGEIRVAVDPEKSVRLTFENLFQDESRFAIQAFRGGEPVKTDAQRETFSLRGKGDNTKCFVGSQNRVEEMAVRVDTGRILATVTVEDASFAEDKEKTFFITTGLRDRGEFTTVDDKRPLRLTVTSDSQDGPESAVTMKFYRGDYEMGTREDLVDQAEAVLANGKSKTWEFAREKKVRHVKIDVARGGGVQVMISQPAPRKKKEPPKKQAQKAPKPVKKAPPPAMKEAAPGSKILGGEIPLMEGSRVLKETAAGVGGRVDMEIPASPEEIVTFYKEALTAKGWQAGMTMIQGPVGVLQLVKEKSQIMLRVKGDGQKSVVNLAVIIR